MAEKRVGKDRVVEPGHVDGHQPARPAAQDMFTSDGVIEFPYAPADFPTRLKGREAIASHSRMVSQLLSIEELLDVEVLFSQERTKVVLEFRCEGMGQGAVDKLRQAGLTVVRGAAGPVHAAARAWLDGQLVDREELCQSHDCQH